MCWGLWMVTLMLLFSFDTQTLTIIWYRLPNWYQLHYYTSDLFVFNYIVQEALGNCVVTAVIKKQHLNWFGHISLIWDLFIQVNISTVTDSICWIWAFGVRGKGFAGYSLIHQLITHTKPWLVFSHPPDQEITACETCCGTLLFDAQVWTCSDLPFKLYTTRLSEETP